MSNLIDLYSEYERCFAVTIELCTMCNWKCLHCYISKHNHAGLSINRVKRLLNELREFGVYEVNFTGGEIFTRSDCMEIVQYARKLGFAVGILSNASLLDDEIIGKLKECHIEFYDCTIFSMDNEVHDTFVQVDGALNQALRNIVKLRNVGIDVTIKCILTKYNWSSYREIKLFCEKNDIKYLFTLDLYMRNNGDDTPLKMCVPKDKLEEVVRETTVSNGYCYKGVTEDDYVCKSTRYSMFIDTYGDVQPCGNFKRKIGNINEMSINDIWKDDSLKKIRNTKIKETFRCGACSLKERCFACAGINELEGYTNLGYREFDCNLAAIREKYFG